MKPESQWTHEDRVAMDAMGSVHGGTWRPVVDGGLTRVSNKGMWRDVGKPHKLSGFAMLAEFENDKKASGLA